MTRRRFALLAAAAACLAVALCSAFLARDVGRTQAALRSGDVTAADATRTRRPSWAAAQTVPFGLARRLLAVDDDLAFRRSVALFRRAYRRIPSFEQSPEGTSMRVQAETALAHELRNDHDRRRASVAANLLGVLALVDATTAQDSSVPIERSVFEFEDAIHLDPGNEQAKANLELVYQQQSIPNTVRGNPRHTRSSQFGASAASQGHGY
jgi:hypothetical protein